MIRSLIGVWSVTIARILRVLDSDEVSKKGLGKARPSIHNGLQRAPTKEAPWPTMHGTQEEGHCEIHGDRVKVFRTTSPPVDFGCAYILHE